jgi:hypothetical protein
MMNKCSSQLDGFLQTIRMKDDDHPQLPVGQLPENNPKKRPTMIIRSSQADDFLKTIRIKDVDHLQLSVGRLPKNNQNDDHLQLQVGRLPENIKNKMR